MPVGLEFGLGRAVPDGAAAAWGARLSYPDDLLPNRQGFFGGHASDAGRALIAWLNGGAIAKAREQARLADNKWKLRSGGRQEVILVKDELGVIVACPQASHGYLYIAGWLHNGDAALQPLPGFEEIVIEDYPGQLANFDEDFDDPDGDNPWSDLRSGR